MINNYLVSFPGTISFGLWGLNLRVVARWSADCCGPGYCWTCLCRLATSSTFFIPVSSFTAFHWWKALEAQSLIVSFVRSQQHFYGLGSKHSPLKPSKAAWHWCTHGLTHHRWTQGTLHLQAGLWTNFSLNSRGTQNSFNRRSIWPHYCKFRGSN